MTNHPTTPPSAVPSSATPGKWHFGEVAEIRAYRINWDDCFGDALLVLDPDTLNPTRMPKEGIRLRGDQGIRLWNALYGSHPEPGKFDCFEPHHAFLFLDDKNKVVGSVDICFQCNTYRYAPLPDDDKGFAQNWDLDAILALVVELGMPISNPTWGSD